MPYIHRTDAAKATVSWWNRFERPGWREERAAGDGLHLTKQAYGVGPAKPAQHKAVDWNW